MPVLLPLRSSVYSSGRPIVAYKLSRALLYAYPSVASRREPCRAASPLRESPSPPLAPSEGHLVSSHTLMKGGHPPKVPTFRYMTASDSIALPQRRVAKDSPCMIG